MLWKASGLLAACIPLICNPLFNAAFCCNTQAVSERPCRWSLSLSVPPVHPPHSARLTPRAVQRTAWNGTSCYKDIPHASAVFLQPLFPSPFSPTETSSLLKMEHRMPCQTEGADEPPGGFVPDWRVAQWQPCTAAQCECAHRLLHCLTSLPHRPSIHETRGWLTALSAARLTPVVWVGCFSMSTYFSLSLGKPWAEGSEFSFCSVSEKMRFESQPHLGWKRSLSPTINLELPSPAWWSLQKTKHTLHCFLNLIPLTCQNPTFHCCPLCNASALLLCCCFYIAAAHLNNSSFPLFFLPWKKIWLVTPAQLPPAALLKAPLSLSGSKPSSFCSDTASPSLSHHCLLLLQPPHAPGDSASVPQCPHPPQHHFSPTPPGILALGCPAPAMAESCLILFYMYQLQND